MGIAVVSGHKSIKARFLDNVGNLKDALHHMKKATLEAVKQKKGTEPGWDEEIAPPTTKCHTVFDEVWQEECGTKFNNSCRVETKPVCTIIRAKECTPEPQKSCTWVMETSARPFQCLVVQSIGKNVALRILFVPPFKGRSAPMSKKTSALITWTKFAEKLPSGRRSKTGQQR